MTVITVIFAFVASLTLTPLARKMAWKIGAISEPDGKRKLHARPTALWGGGAVYVALLLSIIAFCLLASDRVEDKLPAALGFSAGMLCLLGVYDDLYEMSARWKLLGQIVSALPVVLAGCYVEQFMLFGYCLDVGFLGIVWTIGWLVLGVNALNLLDGADGLASIIGIVISVAIGAIAAAQSRPEVMLLAFVLAGALAGFLVHNLPPAKIYLGDSGSMVIGFTLALLTLRVSLGESGSATANLTVAAALLFVPLVDTALAVVRRTLKGCSFMVADHGHIHHQLRARGLSTWAVLAVLGGLGVATGIVAWSVAVSGEELLGWGVLCTVTLALAGRKLIGYEEWCLARDLVLETVVPFVREARTFRAVFGRALSYDRTSAAPPHEATDPMIIPAKGSFEEAPDHREETRKAA